MLYTLKIRGPKGYGFTQKALPENLRLKFYNVLSHRFEPDGGIYSTGKKNHGLYDVPYIEIPTGTLIWELEFENE